MLQGKVITAHCYLLQRKMTLTFIADTVYMSLSYSSNGLSACNRRNGMYWILKYLTGGYMYPPISKYREVLHNELHY